MAPLLAVAKGRKIAIIEDVAQAAGGTYKGQKLGSLGHLGCFSFYPTKNLAACGDGGMVTTRDPKLAALLRSLRDHGQEQGTDRRYYVLRIGTNSRLDAIQAAILELKLPYLDSWNGARARRAKRYIDGLNGLPLGLLRECPQGQHVWNQFTVCTPDRDKLADFLRERGIGTAVFYPYPLHLLPAFAHLGYKPGSLPVCEAACKEVLSLPIHQDLMDDDQDVIIAAIREFFNKSKRG
jgi:dTDP-4-amino-4,6-dideoxygalactose transaminase